jgi:hypothetical protein
MAGMKPNRLPGKAVERTRAMNALKSAIITGATYEYERLVTAAMMAGATEDEIDLLIHDALQSLFARAELPVGPREMAYYTPTR